MPEPALHIEKLLELLGAQHESERLDYKRLIDLSSKRAALELVKDIAAMQAEGGYLVIGVDEQGKPTGELTREYAKQFDESRLRAKMRAFLPEPLELRTATHHVDGSAVVLIYAGPHPDGFVILQADGQAGEDFVFRKGSWSRFLIRTTSACRQRSLAEPCRTKTSRAVGVRRASRGRGGSAVGFRVSVPPHVRGRRPNARAACKRPLLPTRRLRESGLEHLGRLTAMARRPVQTLA